MARRPNATATAVAMPVVFTVEEETLMFVFLLVPLLDFATVLLDFAEVVTPLLTLPDSPFSVDETP